MASSADETAPRADPAHSAFERELRDMNEALLVSSVHQHEVAEQAQHAETALRHSEAELRLRAEELARFNRLAVGRESRIIEMKQQVNALFQRHGEAAPYALEFLYEREDVEARQSFPWVATKETGAATPGAAVAATSAAAVAGTPGEAIAPLGSILHTEELALRSQRPPDHEAQSRALTALVESLAESADAIVRVLTEQILEVLRADSAGISLLTRDGTRFYWPAVAGVWTPHVGGGTPRDFGPCGDVLDRKSPLLFQHPERRYTYFELVAPLVEEALLVPFFVEGNAVGTLWAVSHGSRRFDAEDLRQLESLGRFASAAYQAVGFRELGHSRRDAALNLMEDAVDARRAVETVNAQLRASEERYRTLFTSIDEGFCVIEMLFDPDGRPADYRFIETNPGFEKQTGLHAASGKRIRELSPDHAAHWFERYGRVALTGESVRFVNEAQDLDGRWFDVYAFRLGEPDRHRVACLFTDITQRIRLEAANREYAQSLADLNRRKDEFLAMLSHELRNPLASLSNAAHLLRLQRDRDSVQVQVQGMIDRQIAQLARLVDDLLEVSRIATGRIRLNVERADWRGIVQAALESVQSQASQKDHAIAVSLPEEPVWVNGDPVRLEQIAVNLLTNAIKYTDRGGDIRVALTAEEDKAILRVRDNGVGIAPEMLPRVFDLFTQADRSLDRAQGGLGIGLALVQSLVTMHRGQVDAYSTLGEGSEFAVCLPLLRLPHAPAAEVDEDAPRPAHALKVLVVDDNVDAAESVALLLENWGHHTRLVHDGGSAMEAAVEYRPDVVLLDIGLPVMDGLQLATWMRQQPVLRNAVLVALTGYGQESDRERSRQAGFDHHLVKPVDFARIESILLTAAATSR